MNNPTVYIVHSIDTEGPLYESVEETFKRLNVMFALDGIEPTSSNLLRLQNKEIDLGGQEADIAKVISPKLLNYNKDYAMLDAMLAKIGSEDFINTLPDSTGKGWIYNWHCVDHLDYNINVRRKDIGYHNIYDYYKFFINDTKRRDKIHWHYHPSHYRKVSHYSATNYFRDLKFFEIIARRIIERSWFPSVNRAGFHTERPDSHWLLEQYIPFDLSNQAIEFEDEQRDVSNGRFGDWRRATTEWELYNPSHDDYQTPGNCRRYIGRCLNIGTRFRCITIEEVRKAFITARQKGTAIITITDHDFRDMTNDVLLMKSMLKSVSQEFRDVDFVYSEAREAVNYSLFGEYVEPEDGLLSASISLEQDRPTLTVKAREPIFGPQPFLALKTKTGEFYQENFDMQTPFKEWSYVFDQHSFIYSDLTAIGVGTNDKRGFPQTLCFNSLDELSSESSLNEFSILSM